MHDRQPVYIGNFTRTRDNSAFPTKSRVLCGDLQVYRRTPAEPLKFSTAPKAAKPPASAPASSASLPSPQWSCPLEFVLVSTHRFRELGGDSLPRKVSLIDPLAAIRQLHSERII